MPELEIRVDPQTVAVDDEFTVAIGTRPLVRQAAVTAEFVVALDASLSMTQPALGPHDDGATRWDLARDGALALLAAIPDDTMVHVVLFAGEAQLVTAGEAKSLRLSLERHLPESPRPDAIATDIEAALTTGYRILGRSAATSRTVVLLTDGEPTRGKTRPEDLEALAANAADADVYTRPIGFGAEANVDLLFKISSDGTSDHVKTGAEARDAMKAFMRQLGTTGLDAVASGGELNITVSPYFSVQGVYQVMPSERRLERVARTMPDDSTEVTLRLGSVGEGDDRPVFALRLRAPSRSSQSEIPVLRCSGVIRTGPAVVTLDECNAMVQVTLEPGGYLDGSTIDLINGIDLDAEVRHQAAHVPPSGYTQMYETALARATKEGLSRQVEVYRNTLENLRGGANPLDEFNGQQSTSSRGVTRPHDLLSRPVAVPRPRPAAGPSPFDDEDEAAPRTTPGGPW